MPIFMGSVLANVGQTLMIASLAAVAFAFWMSVSAVVRKEQRFVQAAYHASLIFSLLTFLAYSNLIYAFFTHDFSISYVARYSERAMPAFYLFCAGWGGQDGSLLFWTFLMGILSAIAAYQVRQKYADLFPAFLVVVSGVELFFCIITFFAADPFATLAVTPLDGKGLNPLLQTPVMAIHPPNLYMGLIAFYIPYALGMAALISGKLDNRWIRATRPWTMLAWCFLTTGNLLGAYWAYNELGWGGFWAWDPVENASFLPWLLATAFMHSSLVQERRGMLKVWNMSLVLITYFMTVFGTFLTRSGLIESVHTFAQSDVGTWFAWMLAAIALVSLGLLVWRVSDGTLASESSLDSMFSREGAFLLNNWVLVGCTAVVLFGTLGEKISEYFWQQTKYTSTWFNTWMAPLGLLLLLLMGMGPLLPWRRATLSNLRKNFVVPTLVAAVGTGALVAIDAFHVRQLLAETSVPVGEVPLALLLRSSHLTGVYATIGFFGVLFVVYTMGLEFVRGAIVRARSTGEALPTALARLVAKNQRRYGGYITHVGFALLFLGFIGTGLKTELDLHFTQKGATHTIEGHQLTFDGFERTDNREFEEWFAKFRVHQLDEAGQPGAEIGLLHPSRRMYHGANVRMSRTTTEKDEIHGWKGNLYLSLVSFAPQMGTVDVVAHYNPMIIWMWIGGAFLLVGVAFAIWPEASKYPVFAAARRRARDATPDAVPDAANLARQQMDG